MAAWYGDHDNLTVRKEREAEREAKIAQVFASTNKPIEAAKRDKQQKKRSCADLLKMLTVADIEGKALRPAHTYKPKSYNLERQVMGLIDHLFVKFPVPVFMYRACAPLGAIPRTPDQYGRFNTGSGNIKFDFMYDLYRQWFVTLAQGGSFTKLVKGVMTAKEATMFLRAPEGNEIHTNVWWAKLKIASIPEPIVLKLLDKIFKHHFFDDPEGRLAECIHFYARCHMDMDKMTFDEVTDFAAHKLAQDAAFRFKGRTANSMIQLSNEWHLLIQKAKLGQNVAWAGLGFPLWQWEARDRLWEVLELRNNKELMNEGRKQKHCVYSYVNYCEAGHSAIFSLRCTLIDGGEIDEFDQIHYNRCGELSRVTIEVQQVSRAIVQIKGHLNSRATHEQKMVIKMWAGEKGLTFNTWG